MAGPRSRGRSKITSLRVVVNHSRYTSRARITQRQYWQYCTTPDYWLFVITQVGLASWPWIPLSGTLAIKLSQDISPQALTCRNSRKHIATCCTALHHFTLHFAALHYWRWNYSHSIRLHCTTAHKIILHGITIRLHCTITALQCAT
jgi:hypothetical protein